MAAVARRTARRSPSRPVAPAIWAAGVGIATLAVIASTVVATAPRGAQPSSASTFVQATGSSPTFSPNPIFSPGGAERQVDTAAGSAFPQERGSVAVLTNGNYVYVWPQDNCPSACTQFPVVTVLSSDGTTVVAPFAVTSDTSLQSTSGVSVAALPAGRFVVTWTIPGPKTWRQRFEVDGTSLDGAGAEVNVCVTYCKEWGRAIASDASGNFFIVTETGPSKLRLNGFDKDGNSLFDMTGPIASSIGVAGVAVAPDGTIAVTWNSTDDGHAFAATFRVPANPADDATPVAGPFQVDVGSSYVGSAIGPYPAYAPDGTLYVAYVKHEAGCLVDPAHVLVSTFNAAGTQVGSTFEVGTNNLADGCLWDQGPALEFLSSGSYVVVWSEFEDASQGWAGFEDVRARYFDVNNVPLSPVTGLSSHKSGDEVYPSLAIDQARSRAVVVWQDWLDASYDDAQARSVVYDLAIATPTSRISGADPVELAINVSKQAFPKDHSAPAAVLGRGDNLVDEFVGTPLVARTGGTLLLTSSANLDARTLAELQRALAPGATVYLLGGEVALTQQVAADLAANGFSAQKRLGGARRFETSAAIGDQVAQLQGSNPTSTAFLTESSFLVDAFSAGPAAGDLRDGRADYILLTERGGAALNPVAADFLTTHASITSVEVVGGTAAVPASVETSLATLFPQLSVKRTQGADRFATGAALNAVYFASPTTAVVANGQGARIPGSLTTASGSGTGLFSALLAGAYAAKLSSPLVLTTTDVLPVESSNYLASHASSLTDAIIVGSFTDVSQAVENQVINLL